jgi:hypothetical protein
MYLLEIQLAGLSVDPQTAEKLAADFDLPLLKYMKTSDGDALSFLDWGTPSVLMTAEQLAAYAQRVSFSLHVMSAKRIPSAAAGSELSTVQIGTEAEAARVQRWWNTYNASMTGLHANPGLAGDVYAMDSYAKQSADLAHGELVKP